MLCMQFKARGDDGGLDDARCDAAAQRSLVSRTRLVGLAKGLREEGKNGPQEWNDA